MELSRGLYTTNASSQEHSGGRRAALLLSHDGTIFVKNIYRSCKPMHCEILFHRDALPEKQVKEEDRK